ncbi:hypothetical protein LEN26_011754 [Aphanomyces euteiches]|nr:hypothetical protein LEN26_011754 [Aphanomyces euteiches]KAH9120810.1 hypothetical protein AeMF1_007182 [Aphanomyces euteiches]KAH9181721.1 hypothetical protein AeNC1_016304 [Aphanomyces euteiches]
MSDILVYSGSVYVHQYDSATQGYRPLSDSALGLALTRSNQTKYRLFCYNRAQEEVLSTPLDVHVKFTPQQDHYVNFYDASNQNYSMRFKDDAQVTAFFQAIACAKLYMYRAANSPSVHEDMRMGEGYAVQLGDIAGLQIQAWSLDAVTDGNPIDVVHATPILKDDLFKVKLGDTTTEGLPGLSGQIVGMQRGGTRYIFLAVFASSSYVLAYVELVKVKKEKRSEAPAVSAPVSTDDQDRRDDLVSRMEHLSRMGSSVLVLPTAPSRRTSQQDVTEPVIAPRPEVPSTPIRQEVPANPTRAVLPETPVKAEVPAAASAEVDSLRREHEALLQQQMELARLRKELDDARQRASLEPEPVKPTTTPSKPLEQFQAPPPSSSFSFASPPSKSPEQFQLPPSSNSFAFASPSFPPVAAPPSIPMYQAPPMQLLAPPLSVGNNSEMDATLQRVQRTTLSIEGMLIEVQRKMDRVLNSQTSMSSYHSSGNNSLRRLDMGGSTSSSSLIKGIERALAESDSLREENARLTHQVQDLQRYNNQLQDDIDRLRMDSQRQVDRSSVYGEVQTLQLQLENTKQRCAQMESDAQRWTVALEKERSLRTQLEQDHAAIQRVVAQQTQTLQTQTTEQERKLDEAREIAMLAQKKMQEEKTISFNRIEELTGELQQVKSQYNALKMELEQSQQQIQIERQAHERDANEAKMHLDEFIQERTAHRTKLEDAQRSVVELQEQLRQSQADSALNREDRETLVKELMNDIYFACQDVFEDDVEFTGKEVATQIRKVLKHQTPEVLAKLERK